jgi:hypothetical protein
MPSLAVPRKMRGDGDRPATTIEKEETKNGRRKVAVIRMIVNNNDKRGQRTTPPRRNANADAMTGFVLGFPVPLWISTPMLV